MCSTIFWCDATAGAASHHYTGIRMICGSMFAGSGAIPCFPKGEMVSYRRWTMKVILMRDVDHVGEVGDIVDVADGYGRNFLIPRGLAVAATAKNKRQLEHEQRLREHRLVRARKDAQTLAEQLQGVPCRSVRKAGEKGKLFGSVTAMDIAEALKTA